MLKFLFFISLLISSEILFAQKDTLPLQQKTMDEIVVTSTRTETKLSNVAVEYWWKPYDSFVEKKF